MRHTPSPRRRARGAFLLVAGLAAALTSLSLGSARAESEEREALLRLPPISAVGLRVDTVFLGGYASGPFAEAVEVLGRSLTPQERSLVGGHLERVFSGTDGLGRTGRLRVALERALRADGSTRSVRVLAAEMAVAGALREAYYFEHDGKPGFFDPFGRPLDSGAWMHPLRTIRVTSPFGRRRMHPILRRVLPHTGVDYAAGSGTPVYATGDGVVAVAGRRGGYGTMVEIRHADGLATRYAHLSALSPRATVGAVVKQGDVIGRVGMSGLATGPHLHYEVRRGGRPIDPVSISSAPGATNVAGDSGWPAARSALSSLLSAAPSTAHGS